MQSVYRSIQRMSDDMPLHRLGHQFAIERPAASSVRICVDETSRVAASIK